MGDRGRTGLQQTCGTPPPTPLPQGEGEESGGAWRPGARLAARRAGAEPSGAKSRVARSNAMYREDGAGAVRAARVLAWRRVGQRRGLLDAEPRAVRSNAMYREAVGVVRR